MSGKYRTIVADPPWDFGRDGQRWPTGPPTRAGGTVRREPMAYAQMPSDEIAALPLADLAADDCRLWFWATSAHLPLAFPIISEWGFTYRQTLTWRKTGNPSPFGGSVAPNHAEFLLVATRGRPERHGRLRSSVVDAPKLREHSRKPEMFMDAIESISPGPYLELFARRDRFGWDTWGNECLNTVSTPETVGGGAPR